jgi:Vitamin K-dependent gamma-carboxylase
VRARAAVPAGLAAWWFAPAPLARVAWLRTVVYLFVPVDVLVTTPWVASHGDLAPSLYHPLLIGRLLPLPTPTHDVVLVVEVALLAAALIAATGRAPRVAGTAVLLLYLEWMVIAFSYGKVDHDRFAFLVALAVLPTVGRARHRDQAPSDAAGWALRCVQVAVVATYFLSTWAKFRYGGVEWLNSATLVTAVIRKGTPLATPLLHTPWLLRAAQWGIVAFELSSPAVLAVRSARLRYAWVAGCYAFHVMTFATISIVFLPHCVALLAFLPLERLAASLTPVRVPRPAGAPGIPA